MRAAITLPAAAIVALLQWGAHTVLFTPVVPDVLITVCLAAAVVWA